MMKVGMTCDLNSAVLEKMPEFKPDYIEAHFANMAIASDEDFDNILKKVEKINIPVKTANCFLSLPDLSISVVGENAVSDKDFIEYLEKGFSRAKKVGIGIVVWGSGATRNCPDGFSMEKAKEQMLHYGKIVDEYADKYGIKVAIEPLNFHETNMICTVKEGAEFVKLLNGKNMKVLADSYHMCVEDESFDTLKDYKDCLIHAHISDKNRKFPSADDELGASEFVYKLRDMNYDGDITIEAGGRGGDWSQEVKEAISAVKKWAQQ